MLLKCIMVIAAIVLSDKLVNAINCVNAPTYDGATTLTYGQSACAELQPGETEADKGLHYVTCDNGYLITKSCAGLLRFDTLTQGCNFPEVATCDLPYIL